MTLKDVEYEGSLDGILVMFWILFVASYKSWIM